MFCRHIPRSLGIIASAVTMMAIRPCAASVVVFNCTGTITNGGTDRDVFNDSVGPGTSFSAVFQIGTNANDLYPADPVAWNYYDKDPLHEAYVSFGDYHLSPDPTGGTLIGMTGANNSGGIDMYQWQSYNSAGNGLAQIDISASLQDNTGTALTAKGIPPVGPGLSDISRWDSATMSLMATSMANGHRHGWNGVITSISTSVQPNTIPEPGGLRLLALGAIPGVLAVSRRRLMSV